MQSVTTYLPEQSQSARHPARLGRVGLVGLSLLVALFGVGVLALMIGVTQIPAEEVLRIVFTEGGERVPRIVVWEVRMPRFLLGAMTGAALAVAGAMLQDALKNELAEPDLLGVASGASLVVAAVVILNIAVPFGTLPLLALLGGLLAGGVILLATRLTRDPVKMILIGAALAALFSALITAIVVLGEADEIRVLYSYLVGSVIGRGWDDVRLMLPWIAIALPVALLQTVTRNPLAESGLMGVSSGGVLAIIVYITVFANRSDLVLTIDSGLMLPLAGVVGGMTAATLTYLLSYQRGSDPVRLVLTGLLVGGCAALSARCCCYGRMNTRCSVSFAGQ